MLNDIPFVHVGVVGSNDYKNYDPGDDNDIELDKTPEEVTALIGFDPKELDTATKSMGVSDPFVAERKLRKAVKKTMKIFNACKDMKVDPKELQIGIETEMKEHRLVWNKAMQVALDHLKEHSDYYTKLLAAGLE